MTKQEHTLIISMFVKQQMFIQMLVDVLKSRGIVSEDDLPAYAFSVGADANAMQTLFDDMTSLYVQVAAKMGIQLDITAR